ncbi:Low affinity sulfate transporter 3 [Olea europaea subsp. europaea]|uniref:Low affinity sulfate transporter 3 n=1 Tax=Olea europaea subsp. europaea TaxID=158383 RepID=A0A8S0TBS0_OLEEU|nr:Low affinity sulfate transporter 3 [Olea europaea subsp. europaea]
MVHTPTFCSMQQPIRDGLWDRFMDKYGWPTVNTFDVYDMWKVTVKDRYRDMMNDAREKAKTTSQSDNPTNWKGHGPRWIRAKHCDSLVNYWNTKKWKKKNAKIAKENHLAQGKDGERKKHIVGLVSFVITKKRLEKAMDRPISQLEFFNHVHRKNQGLGDFVDKKSKRVHDTYKTAIESKYGTVRNNQPEFDLDSWIDAVNGPSKGHVYGFCPGQLASLVLGIPTSPRHSILARDEEMNNLKSELAIAQNTIDENSKRIDDLTVRLERVERNQKIEKRKIVRSMLRELNIPNFQFPSSSGFRNDDM